MLYFFMIIWLYEDFNKKKSEIAYRGGGGGGGIRKLRPFWGFKILNFNIFGVFQENEYFLGYEEFVDVFAGSTQN